MWYTDFNKTFFTCIMSYKDSRYTPKCNFMCVLKKSATSLQVSSRSSKPSTLYVPASYFDFHPYLTIYVESTNRNFSTHLCGSLCTKVFKTQFFNGISRRYTVPNFTKICEKQLEISPLRTEINLTCISDSVRTAQ